MIRSRARPMMLGGAYAGLIVCAAFLPDQLAALYSKIMFLADLGIDMRLHFTLGLLVSLVTLEAFRSTGRANKLELALQAAPENDLSRRLLRESAIPLLIVFFFLAIALKTTLNLDYAPEQWTPADESVLDRVFGLFLVWVVSLSIIDLSVSARVLFATKKGK